MNLRPPFLWSVCAVLAGACTLLVQHDPFFWDTVQLASKHAHFFYQQHLVFAPLPPDIDSGHPPLLGYYLAVLWTFFGKSLVVSHWAIWPFLTGILYVGTRLGQQMAGQQWGVWLPVLLFADPVMAGQAALVSPDILVACGFMMAVYGIRTDKKWLVMVGVLLLCTTSMRGMMVTAALAFWVWLAYSWPWKKLIHSAMPFIPGVLAGVLFLTWHYQATGWVGHFEGSTWSAAFERTDTKGMVRNIAVLGWRWTDMDRLVEWVILIGLVWRSGWRTFFQTHRTWILLLLCLVLFLSPSAILYKNLSAHRYFLPVFMALHLLVFAAITQSRLTLLKKHLLSGVLALLLAAGNYWINPRGISMDWDSTLAHWPYHTLRKEVVQYLDQNHIPLDSVGSAFPNINTGENLLLNGDNRSFAELDLDHQQWMLVSNVFNDIDEPEYAVLNEKGQLVKRWEKRGVWMELWKIME